MSMPQVAARGTNTMAILSLVFAFVFAPLGIVFGVMARKQIPVTGESGEGIAKAGLILSVIFTLLSVTAIVLSVVIPVMLSTP